MYDWDACFFAQAAHLTKLPELKGLGLDVVANFLSLKGATGQIPRTISPQRIWDQEISAAISGTNTMARI